MQGAERSHHRAVARHRVVDAGEDHHAAVQGIEDRENHRSRDHGAAEGAEENVRRFATEVVVAPFDHRANRLVGQNAEDRVVEEDVKERDADDREDDRQGERTARVLDFFGDAVEVRPPFVGPEGRNDREGHGGKKGARGRKFFRHRKDRRFNVAHNQARTENDRNRKELQNHEDILNGGTRAHAPDVHKREKKDGARGEELLREGSHRDDGGKGRGKSDGQSRNRRGSGKDEARKAAHKRGAFAVGFAKINVGAPRLGHHRAELGVANAAHEGDEAACDPDEKSEAEIHTRTLEHDPADIEDPRADHDARKDRYASEEADFTTKFRHGESPKDEKKEAASRIDATSSPFGGRNPAPRAVSGVESIGRTLVAGTFRWRFRPPSRRHTPRKRTSSRSIAPPKALADFRESRKYFSRAQRPTDASIGVSAVWPFPGIVDCRLPPGTHPHRASICECAPPSNPCSSGGTGTLKRFRLRAPSVSGSSVLRLPLLLICTNSSGAWSYLTPFTRLFCPLQTT